MPPDSRTSSVLPVVDSHQHFWDLDRLDYEWIPPAPNVLARSYLPEDLAPLLERNLVSRTVLLQAHSSVEESRFLLDLADDNDFIAGVVGWVDLTSSNVGDVLDELARRPRLVGIRHQVHDEPDEAWILRDDVVRGLREVAQHGLAYDLLLRPQHLKYVRALAERVPDLRMVVDHLAKPLITDGLMEPFAADIAAVAAVPGVYCKVSGMITEADHANWTVENLKPYVAHVIEHFGFDRLMWGSDWPVCLLAAKEYDDVRAATIDAMGDVTHEQWARFMGGSAIDFYGL